MFGWRLRVAYLADFGEVSTRPGQSEPGDKEMNLGKFDHDRALRPSPGIMVRIQGITPKGRKSQVSEIL
jgi:hypothetical protein